MGLATAGVLSWLQNIHRSLEQSRKDQVTLNANVLLLLDEQRRTNELLAAVAAPRKVVASGGAPSPEAIKRMTPVVVGGVAGSLGPETAAAMERPGWHRAIYGDVIVGKRARFTLPDDEHKIMRHGVVMSHGPAGATIKHEDSERDSDGVVRRVRTLFTQVPYEDFEVML